MSHSAAQLLPIDQVAQDLGLNIQGHKIPCFNSEAHHNKTDRNPSLVLYGDSGRYKCFSCGIRGDCIDLVRAVRGCDFRDAVSWLEMAAGDMSPRPPVSRGHVHRKARQPDEAALRVYSRLHELCHLITAESSAGSYLKGRGLDLDVVSQHHVVELLDPDDAWHELTADFSAEQLKAAGLVSRKDHFLFSRHRLLFFYFDNSRPVYLQGRDVTGKSQAKELSLAGLSSPVPYNAELTRMPYSTIYLCEGCIDTLSAIQMGLPAVGIPGVTGFNSDWFTRFSKTSNVVLLFDNDDAGHRQASELCVQFRKRGISAEARTTTHGKDVNDHLLHSTTEG